MASTISAGTTTTTALVYSADTSGVLQLQTNGGTTAVTIDTNQNVGVGVTPSAWNNIFKAVQINAQGSLMATSASMQMGNNIFYDGAYKFIGTGYSNRYYQSSGQHIWTVSNASGSAGNTVTEITAMTLDASNNLLVGTTTANANFYVYGAPVSYAGLNATAIFSSSASQSTGTGGLIAFEGKYTSGGAISNFAAIGGLKENSTDNNYSGYLGFYTRSNGSLAAERARIDSSGNVLVGTTTNNFGSGSGALILGAGRGLFTASSNSPIAISRLTSTGALVDMYYGSTFLGSISTNGSTITYGGTSDYRLKENIAPLTGGLSKVLALKPSTFTWKNTNIKDDGFIAHELQEICPNAVIGEKDAVNEDGSIKAQQIDTSFLVATLTSAIQELSAQVTTLQTQVTALKG